MGTGGTGLERRSFNRSCSQRDDSAAAALRTTPNVDLVAASHLSEPFVGDSFDSDPSDAAVDEVLRLVSLLPPSVGEKLLSDPRLPSLLEVVMDLGRPPLARFPGIDLRLSEAPVDEEDLNCAIASCGHFGGDNRAGIDGTLHRISAIRNRSGRIVGLTCRVGRSIRGSAAMVADLATAGKSILLLGGPGVGKTTAIREMSRLLADSFQRRVIIVDTSNEIGGDGDIPHPGIGRARRMQVALPEEQHRVMIEAVENHMPEVVVIDEIGTEAEALAARTIAQRGVQLIATAHGNELGNVMKNPSLNDLVGGVMSVTLGDDEAKRRGVQKSILERESPPTFDVAVEIIDREKWRLHLDVGAAVDSILLGRDAGSEMRERDARGKVWTWPEDYSLARKQSRIGGGDDHVDRSSEECLNSRLETRPFPGAMLSAARTEVETLLTPQAFNTQADAAERKSVKKRAEKRNRDAGPVCETLQVFLYGIDPESVHSVADALGMCDRVTVVCQIQDADAVLATRARLKSSGWIRGAAQASGIPIFTVRSSAVDHVVKGVRAVLGVDPSPSLGALFRTGRNGDIKGDDPRGASPQVLRVETSVPLQQQGEERTHAGRRGGDLSLAAAGDALEEASHAIQAIVLPHGQPAELQPRADAVIVEQVALARKHGLECEFAGTVAGRRRVRVLPKGFVPAGPVKLSGVQGGKEYW